MNTEFIREHSHNSEQYIPISLGLEGGNLDQRFTDVLLSSLRMIARLGRSESSSLLERNHVIDVFDHALKSEGRQSLLLRRVVEVLRHSVHSGVEIENLQFMIESLQKGDESRLFGQNSLTQHQSNEFAVLLMLGVHRVIADELKIHTDPMNSLELYWFLQWIKYYDSSAGSLSHLYIIRDEFTRMGVWQAFVRAASLCQKAEGFDTLHRLEQVIYLMDARDVESYHIRSFMSKIENYLDEIQRVTEELVESMVVNDFNSTEAALIHDMLLSRLRNDVYLLIVQVLNQVAHPGSDLLPAGLGTYSAEYATRLAIARELNHYIAVAQRAIGGEQRIETELFMRLLNIRVEDVSVDTIPESDKIIMEQMFRTSRECDLTSEELERDTAGFADRLRTSGTTVRIVRDTNNRLISFVCYAPEWNDPNGIYVTNLTFGADPDIVQMRGVLSAACFASLAQNYNVHFSVYRNTPAYRMYVKRTNVVEDPARSSEHVAAMIIPAMSVSKTA
jgi:hypothetical protein